MRLLDCQKCSNWRCEELTYEELLREWERAIGGTITPGHLSRYKKQATLRGVSVEEIQIGYKYCAASMLKRFYLRKGGSDQRATVPIKDCPQYTIGAVVETTSRLWQICTVETHGLSEAKGITFTAGLYENNTYMRIPLYGSVRPQIERVDTECSLCGQRVKRSITVKLEKTFCCNKHYLEWWMKRYKEECGRLNR